MVAHGNPAGIQANVCNLLRNGTLCTRFRQSVGRSKERAGGAPYAGSCGALVRALAGGWRWACSLPTRCRPAGPRRRNWHGRSVPRVPLTRPFEVKCRTQDRVTRKTSAASRLVWTVQATSVAHQPLLLPCTLCPVLAIRPATIVARPLRQPSPSHRPPRPPSTTWSTHDTCTTRVPPCATPGCPPVHHQGTPLCTTLRQASSCCTASLGHTAYLQQRNALNGLCLPMPMPTLYASAAGRRRSRLCLCCFSSSPAPARPQRWLTVHLAQVQ